MWPRRVFHLVAGSTLPLGILRYAERRRPSQLSAYFDLRG